MNLIVALEFASAVAASSTLLLLLNPRERRLQGVLAPALMGLVGTAALLHVCDFFEWRGYEAADRLGDMIRFLVPVLWIGLAFDAYRRARTEETSRRLEQFRIILEQVTLPTILIDDRGLVLDCSDSFLFRTAAIRQEVVGRPFFEVANIPTEPLAEAWKTGLASAGAVSSTRPARAYWAGEELDLSWVAQRWLDPGTGLAAGVSIILQVAEDDAADELETMMSKATTVMTPIVDDGMPERAAAHDLANFLQMITGQAELLAYDLDYQFRHRALSISEAGHSASELVRALASPARQESVKTMPIDLGPMISSTVTLLEPTLSPTINVIVHAPRTPLIVMGDRVKLQRVVVNLLVNARDAMPSGGTIEVTLEPDADRALLRVADDGVGVDEALRDRIFDRYFTTKSPGQGNGIGLALVSEIVAAHGGEIQLEEGRMRGASFVVRLPLALGVSATR